MRRGGRQGRGERARVERRVREVLGTADVVAVAADAGAAEPRGAWSGQPRVPLPADPAVPRGAWAGLPSAPLQADTATPVAPLAAPPLRPPRHRAPGLAARVVSRALARGPVRLDASRSTAVALAVVIAVVALAVGAWVLSARPQAVPVTGTAAPSVSSASSVSSATALPIGSRPAPSRRPAPTPAEPSGSPPSPSSSSGVPVVVDVAGRVHRPGLYRLPAGARVDDALRAAGGALPGVDLAAINLAAALVDGEQVAVGIAPAPGAVPSAATGSRGSATAAGPVHLNTATADQLQALPGVGPVLAQHILDFRTAHGSFTSVDQLNDVPGIGDSKFTQLRTAVVL